ncbi:hypothetical protein TTHERM_00564410 (macronuclear) [Tetrahymena thermophila SB210]|uniref:Rab-GAP TBC domain-containing protein n=1 Tax=Tetrahymena thermophila (strain SB210) TaxID=312017 RepID=I7LWH2_TETTS|nr:hypothetical protein TTHERM_00564410 [Tetrahymena thermophila SB210]EAS01795.2 hypothetical protein TTHERM_00564410 [Tetrahymena thermophila SB210]|eukprot:XP_001022040.2 hypothetical protein TTHERM_00564410 [Tetrahymena thermophila SB210]
MSRENRFNSNISNLEVDQRKPQNVSQSSIQQPLQSNFSSQSSQMNKQELINSQQKKQMYSKQSKKQINQEKDDNTDNLNLVIQTQGGASLKNLLGLQHTFNQSPNLPTDSQNEENKFTFEKVDNQNRDKVDSYQSATFRKGSELIHSQTNQIGSITSLQNDQNITNSQQIAQQLIGVKQNNFQKSSIVLNSTFVNQNQSSISQNQSQIQQPILFLKDKNITTKQYMQKIKECLQNDYENKLIGLFKFAQLYSNYQKEGQLANNDLIEATMIYDNQFQIAQQNNQQNLSQLYLHDYQKMFQFQKQSSLGRTVLRQCCIYKGQIRQPIEDKNQKRSKSPITQKYKEKEINKFQAIEEKGKIYKNTLQWKGDAQKKFRVMLRDNKNHLFAVYTEDLEEAIKIRDYFLCLKIEDQNTYSDVNLRGLFKKTTIYRQKDRFMHFFQGKLRSYASYLKNQQLQQQQQQQLQLLLQEQKKKQEEQLIKEKMEMDDIKDCDIELDQKEQSNYYQTNQSNSPFQSNKFKKVKKNNNDSLQVDNGNKSQVNISQLSDKSHQSVPAQANMIESQQFIDSHRNDMILDEESIGNNGMKINETNNNNSIKQKERKPSLQIPEIRDVFLKNQSILKEYENLQKQFELQDEKDQDDEKEQNEQKYIYQSKDQQNQAKWNQRDCRNIIVFRSTNNKIQVDKQSVNLFFNKIHFLREYDKILKSAFREQLKMRIRNRAENEIFDIKKKIEQEKEKADIFVDIFLTFQELKFEFKNEEKNDQSMVFKPKLTLQIMKMIDLDPRQKQILNDQGDTKPKMQFIFFGDQNNKKNVAELKARVFSKQGNFKEFELYGDNKVADIRNVKLIAIKKNEMKIQIIDEITGSLIAKNSIKMEKILSKNDFMSSQITIEPVQSLCDKLAIQVSLQSLTVEQKNGIQFQDNKLGDNSFSQKNNQNEYQDVKEMRIETLSQYIESILAKQNYILDNFYQCRIFLEPFSPSQFKIVLELISELKIDTTPLQLSLRKQSHKLECYRQVRAILFKHYLEQQSYHQSILVKNLNCWNNLYDKIVAQADVIEYGNNQRIDNNYLDTSDNFILRDACDEIKKYDFDAGNDYIQQMQSGRDSVSSQDDIFSNRRIVTSVFYKRDLWEQDTSQQEFYQEMLKHTEKGIPNSLRQTLWLEIGKSSKYTHMINRLLLSLDKGQVINSSLSEVYQNLLKKAYQFQSSSTGQSFISEIQDMQADIYWYKEHILFIDDQMLISLTNIFYAYCHYVYLQNSRTIYSKYLIPFAARALDYFKSESKESDDSIEENAFWLVVCFTNNFAKRYYNTQLMIEAAQQIMQEQLLEQSSKQNNNALKTEVISKQLVQSQISMLPANNPTNNHQKIQTKLNYIPDDIRLDMLIFEFYFKEKNQKLYNFLTNVSFGIGLFFAEKMLSYFSDLFNHELLFRIWDYLFVEGSSKNTLKATYFGIAVMIHFLDKNSKSIVSKCKSKKDTLLYIQLAARFEFDCDNFISEAVKLYKNIIDKDPVRFPKNQQQQQSTQNPAVALAKTTKLIFHQIISVSNKIFNQTLQNYLETVDQAYKQLDMQRYLNQLMFVQTLVQFKDTKKIDLKKLKKVIEKDIFYKHHSSDVITLFEHSRNQSQIGNELSVSNIRSRSTSQISVSSQTRNQQQGGLQLETIKPIYNIYSKQPEISKIFIYIHQIQILEDYNELNVEVKFENQKSVHLVKRLSATQIIECFDRSKDYIQKVNEQKAITITVYRFQDNTVIPVKQTKIYFSNYQPDVITKDYTIMYEYENVDDYFLNSNSQYENDKNQANNQSYNGRIDNVKEQGRPLYNYDSGVEFTILLATPHGMGESKAYQNILYLKRIQATNNISLTGNSINIQNISSYLIDKYNYVPEVFHVRKNQQAESKLKQFNQIKSENFVEIIQNKSLNTIKNMWKQKTTLSLEEFKEFVSKTDLIDWNDLNINEIKNHFSYEGKICLFDFLLVCILLVEGRYLEKVDVLRKLFKYSAPVQVCEERERLNENDNPFIYTSIINELYCKNILFLPLNIHFHSLKLKNLPHIEKAKYFLENQSVQSQGDNQSSQKQLGANQSQQNQPINEAQTQSRINKTVDITIFMQSFCAQQSLFKGTFDIFIDSPEFADALKQYLKEEYKVDNPTGKLQAFYWTKGQLRQLQAQYTYQTLGLVLNYVKQQKTKLSKNNSILKAIQNEQDVKNQIKQQSENIQIQSVYKLLQFNDTLVNLNYDNYEMEEQEVNNTFFSLPLLSYFNSLQNSVYNHSRPNRKNNSQDRFTKQFNLQISVDNVNKCSFRLIASQKKQESQSIQEEVSYFNKQFRTILEDWNIIKNLKNLPQQNNVKLDKLDMSIDHIPLYYKIKDLAKLLTYRLMESCINKVEEYFSYNQGVSQWISFFHQIKSIDMLANLEGVYYQINTNRNNKLDPNLDLEQNLIQVLNLYNKTDRDQQTNLNDLKHDLILNFSSSESHQSDDDVSKFEQPLQYAIYNFKDGGKLWMPCKIEGYVKKQKKFQVKFFDFPERTYLREEEEIAVDQDIQILNITDEEYYQNEQNNHNLYNDNSVNLTLETQHWDQSQFGLANTRINSSQINVMNTSNNFNQDYSRYKNTQFTQDAQSYYQPTQEDIYQKDLYEFQNQKTQENFQTEFESPIKSQQYQKQFY